MQVKVIKSGLLQTNSYIVSIDNECIIIDPAFAYKEIRDYILDNGYKVLAILLTHGHFDHIECSNNLAKQYMCKVYISKYDFDMALDPVLNGSRKYLKRDIMLERQYVKVIEKEIILKLDNFMIDVLFTPGHSKGSCCFLIGEELFSGDTLFRNGIGRVDLYGGDNLAMDKSLKYIFSLNDEVVVFPGHGDDTTILEERNRYI